ncbi:MAG: deoxyribose-phosphate aldolase [Spirochaetales bacterium]|jgi:deoxyribose-phosphate aldolase|nr:deoxyribose-phosphate aldolase [Spirochaetales bacterium]
MALSHSEIAGLIDVSCVRANVSYRELNQVAGAAIKHNFICAFAMPCHTEKLRDLLKGSPVKLGGVVGFPSGADTAAQKVEGARYMKSIGCQEIDMVINVGAVLSGDDDYVREEIRRVIEAAHPLPVKSILECAYLKDEEIVRACRLAVEAGVSFVKSGTGWANKPTTVETIRIMKKAVGDKTQIKAAGGVRTLAALEEMYAAGCRRFGIGLTSALAILKEVYRREGEPFEEIF